MTNLEKIIAASKMGYSAILNDKYKVIHISEDSIVLGHGEFIDSVYFKDRDTQRLSPASNLNNYEVTGYLYVGHLFGEPVIEEGQKFRVEETGEVGKFFKKIKTLIVLDFNGVCNDYSPNELEPVFDQLNIPEIVQN